MWNLVKGERFLRVKNVEFVLVTCINLLSNFKGKKKKKNCLILNYYDAVRNKI